MSLLSTALLHAGSKKSMECKRSALKPKVYDLFFSSTKSTAKLVRNSYWLCLLIILLAFLHV